MRVTDKSLYVAGSVIGHGKCFMQQTAKTLLYFNQYLSILYSRLLYCLVFN